MTCWLHAFVILLGYVSFWRTLNYVFPFDCNPLHLYVGVNLIEYNGTSF